MMGLWLRLSWWLLAWAITIMGFQWRQNVAMERRLREDSRELESRLREESQGLESRLRGDIQTLERRLETTDADVKTLIGEVGLIKGALLGVSDEVTRSLSDRESALTP